MIRHTFLSITALMLLAAAGCSRPAERSRDSVEFATESAVQAYTLDNSAADYGLDSDLRVACRSSLLLPQAIYDNDISQLQDTIRAVAYGKGDGISLPQDFFRTAAEEFGFSVTPLELTPQITDSIAAGIAAAGAFDGFVNVDGYAVTLTQRILSYAVASESYAPRAAHGIYETRYLNYDIAGNRVFGLADIFTGEGLTRLPAIISRKASLMAPVVGSTTIEALPSDNNFTVNAEGNITFIYQPYEVASYAQGIIAVPVQTYTVDSLLTDYGRNLLLSE